MKYEAWVEKQIKEGKEVSPEAVWNYFARRINTYTCTAAISKQELVMFQGSNKSVQQHIEREIHLKLSEGLLPHLKRTQTQEGDLIITKAELLLFQKEGSTHDESEGNFRPDRKSEERTGNTPESV